ncbi:MAG: hypothetical protein JWN23_1891 [Rhodocyclales bacterium]|nr:hypothetical protein [Rhodocyclales bacterium]
MDEGLWVILLEAGLALSLLLLIVWATWPKGKSESRDAQVTGPTAKEKAQEVARERVK